MKQTKKNNSMKKNKTIKKKNICPIGLKPFEKEFEKNITAVALRKSSAQKKKEFVFELMSKFAPGSVKPENNFYDYINYQWLKNVSLEQQQKYIIQIDDFRLVQDKVYKQLDQLILDYIKHNNNSLSKNLHNYRTSVINLIPKSRARKIAIQAEQLIDKFFLDGNPWALLAYFNSDEMISFRSPFVWSLNPDDKNTKTYASYVTPHQFILLDLNVYFDDGKDTSYKTNYRLKYFNYVHKLFSKVLGKTAGYNARDVFDVEVQIFDALGCVDVTSGVESTYNKISGNDALKKYGFDWHSLAKHLGFKSPPEHFITSSLNYLKCGTKLFLENWNTPKWKTFWMAILLDKIARLTKDWEKILFKFKGQIEKGQERIIESEAVSAATYMSVPFNTFLTNQYVSKYEDPQTMLYVKTLCDDLKIVFRRILTRNTWLQPSTKKYALKKLDNFNFVYGKPEHLREDPDLNYTTDLYDNITKINEWRHKKFIELQGKHLVDIPILDWSQYPVKMTGTQAYIVNASYTPSKNSIYINLGYIQKPFVDLDERGIEYNLAHLGFTISHEMSHGFDDWGSKYGWDGNLNDWWTTKDKNKYKSIQKDVIKQYEEFAARDNIHFDASIGVGEDLADISGLAICDEYLRDFQDKNEDLIPIRSLSYQGFYTYFAFQQRQFVSKKAISAQLKTNPHPLDKYRTNVPLSRSAIFRALYNVKKGNGMWWHNMDTVW